MAVREVKVCLLGESGVGKSSIVLRFVNDSFKPALESTIGASFMTKRLDVDGVSYQFQIWDTAGQEKYRSLAPMYYRGAAAAIIVYDITREATFRTVKDWVRELKRNCTTDLVLAIAGNKSDLNDLREVRVREAEEYAQSIGAHFIETSALSAINVPQLFKAIAEELPPEDSISVRPGSTVHLRRHDENKETQTSCCGSKKSR
ncbi:ras-related protein Rab-22A-like isoform X1 [Ostrea edulis]|uniref:ras-related protein Rab-22A-like isoform X1 n=1 Tax=Ostrea edulis TaxID=37623 RepID=UPI002095CFE7|nr:ras-related protein Rab-22A-like isoform X1 [Ostrea edulis]